MPNNVPDEQSEPDAWEPLSAPVARIIGRLAKQFQEPEPAGGDAECGGPQVREGARA